MKSTLLKRIDVPGTEAIDFDSPRLGVSLRPPRLAFHDCAPAHLPELVDLWVESWSEVHPGVDFEPQRGWFVDHVMAWLAAGDLALGAFDSANGAMAGFILLSPTQALLDQICVAARRKGDGTALALLAETRRLCSEGFELSVNALNHRAIRFYEREGFIRTGEGISRRSGQPIFHYRWRP